MLIFDMNILGKLANQFHRMDRKGEEMVEDLGSSEADPGMLHPAWVILCPAIPRWNLGSDSEINVSSVNLWAKLGV